ncbi:MAG: hypothetical protein Q9M28_09220 [Mariprofundaceae bacterium]|nr:hypothetical protein [Mariprofundaceae bacterium]
MKSYGSKIQKTLLATALLSLSVSPAYAAKVTDKLEISGKAFLGLHSNKVENFSSATQTTTVKSNTTGATVDRFYLQAKYHLNDQWYGRITTDVNNETKVGLKRNTNVFLKYAYVEGKLNDALQVRLGLSHTPWIDYEQKLWKHRYIAKVYSDFFKFDDSADYGVGLKGKALDKMVEYWFTYTNGGGYGKPNASQAMDVNGRLTVHPIKGMDISAGFRSGYRGKKLLATVNPTKEDMNQVMISHGTKTWRVGANFLTRTKKNNVSTTQTDSGYTAWAWANFGEYGVFGRYDYMKSTPFGGATSAKTVHYVAGVEYFATKGMNIALALDTSRVTNGNDTWKFTATGDTSKSTKIGLYSQFKF